ncbi:MAG: GNAT family N-acetyltransferase [Rhodobacteraceae bacterium]|nr:GNAT family N-acetyltransferase [Paracoccaceae bacterium]
MTVHIRPYDARDAATVTRILVAAFRPGDTYTVDPAISPDDALAYWCAPEKTVFVAETDRVLGTYCLRRNQAGGGAHVCNAGFVTDPAARGQGVASAMLTHALDTARAQGYRAMQFNFVVSTNEGAIRLWTRAGFATVGRLPGAFRHPREGYVDALVMYRNL